MQRQNSPLRRSDSILLYGFGLALALSLLFNGFLLFEQSRQRITYDYEAGTLGRPAEQLRQQTNSAPETASLQKDSRIVGSANSPVGKDADASPDSTSLVHRASAR
jgi:hypothetical protein